MSQDSRDDVSTPSATSSAPDEETLTAACEELLAAVINAKEGQRSLSTIFKVLPPKDVSTEYMLWVKKFMQKHGYRQLSRHSRVPLAAFMTM